MRLRDYLTVKRLILVVVLSAVIIVVGAICTVPKSTYSSFVKEQVITLAADNDIQLHLEGEEVRPIALSSKRGSIELGKFPFIVQLFFSETEISLKLAPLLSGKLRTILFSSLYGGSLSGELLAGISSGSGTVTANWQKINLGEHHQLQAVGITSGELSGKLESLSYSPEGVKGLAATVEILGLKKPEEQKFMIPNPSFPFTLSIPPFSIDSAKLGITGTDNIFTVSPIIIDSSLCTVEGELSFQINQNSLHRPIELKSLSLKIGVTDDGKKEIGTLLPLVSGGRVSSGASLFTIEFEGESTPKWAQIK